MKHIKKLNYEKNIINEYHFNNIEFKLYDIFLAYLDNMDLINNADYITDIKFNKWKDFLIKLSMKYNINDYVIDMLNMLNYNLLKNNIEIIENLKTFIKKDTSFNINIDIKDIDSLLK